MADDPPLRVLVVDGGGTLAETASGLERADPSLAVETTASGRDAVERMADDPVDCVVATDDVGTLDALAFVECLRADRPRLPIVLFPGAGSEALASDAIAAGVTDYVPRTSGSGQYETLARRIHAAVAGERARDVERRARVVLESLPDAVLVVVDGAVAFANPAATDRFAGERVAGRRAAELFEATSDGADVANAIEDATGDPQIRTVRAEVGATETATDVIVYGIEWDGDPATLVILHERTPPVDANPLETRYHAAFDNAFDAILIADDNGRYVDANESACELFGLPKAELLGKSVADFAAPDFDFAAAWERFQASDDERGTFPLVTPDGDRRIVEYAATTDILPGEHLSIVRDVTEREHRLAQIEDQNAKLEEFASIVSHDLRNPLATAKGYLEVAAEEGDPEAFDRVERNLDRMDRIIENVLWLAREGIDVGETGPVDLDAAVDESWETARGAGTEATLEHADDLGTVRASESRLRQLLENVLANAIEHAGPDVTVRVEGLEDGFAIEDDGPGIPADLRESDFERGVSTAEEGTGFGLAIVKRIVDGHGWSVTATAGSEGGARFEFRGVERLD